MLQLFKILLEVPVLMGFPRSSSLASHTPNSKTEHFLYGVDINSPFDLLDFLFPCLNILFKHEMSSVAPTCLPVSDSEPRLPSGIQSRAPACSRISIRDGRICVIITVNHSSHSQALKFEWAFFHSFVHVHVIHAIVAGHDTAVGHRTVFQKRTIIKAFKCCADNFDSVVVLIEQPTFRA